MDSEDNGVNTGASEAELTLLNALDVMDTRVTTASSFASDWWGWVMSTKAQLVSDSIVLRHQAVVQKVGLQAAVRSRRLRVFSGVSESLRRIRQVPPAADSAREWLGMLREDAASTSCRHYLTVSTDEMRNLARIFNAFDDDGDGSLSVTEFQDMVFEMGEAMSPQEAREAMSRMSCAV